MTNLLKICLLIVVLLIWRMSRLSCFRCNLGAIGMKQGGNNGHSGQFSHSLVYCVDIMEAIPRCGHKEQLTLNQPVVMSVISLEIIMSIGLLELNTPPYL